MAYRRSKFLVCTEPLTGLEQMGTDLAPDLKYFLNIVIAEIVVRGIADTSNNEFRNCVRVRSSGCQDEAVYHEASGIELRAACSLFFLSLFGAMVLDQP
jgi:hypothetical protein